MIYRFIALAILVSVLGCKTDKGNMAKDQMGAKPAPAHNALSRNEFNVRAQERFIPLFWRADTNGNQMLDADELVVLWGPWDLKRSDIIDGGRFLWKFESVYAELTAPENESNLDDAEKKRRAALRLELSQGRPSLVETNSAAMSASDQAILKELAAAAVVIEKIYARQHAVDSLGEKIPSGDAVSRAVFHRNQSPFCVAPKTENDPACSVFPDRPKRLVGLYPLNIQEDPKFCATLEKAKNKSELMDHFSVVEAADKGFKTVPYTAAYKDEMETVAKHLETAAAATEPSEAAFKGYLLAAATSFRTNDWEPANEAWVAMGPTNSKWYLRVAPDEVYHEPCAWKAGFALQLARINPDSLAWQEKLEPVKQDMEKALAGLAGAPYKARDVKFKLPDFIDVVLNSADQRNPHGATIGQSLPNWGTVSEKGGRTVVMTNLYTDVDSQEALKHQMESMFCESTMKVATTSPKPALMSVVLHEAAHNLGPSHDYAVKGKKDDDIFGGTLAATMEELKAQTSALYFVWWLADKKVVTEQDAMESTVRDTAWAFGHISRGMYDAGKNPRNYSQLASIQLGLAYKAGALVWKKDDKAANGSDLGCFEIEQSKWRPMVDAMAKRVLTIKGKGDKKDAEKLKAEFVDDTGEWNTLRGVISERWLRAPKSTFVYSF